MIMITIIIRRIKIKPNKNESSKGTHDKLLTHLLVLTHCPA